MQISVLPAGTPGLLNALMFPGLHPSTRAWLDQQYLRDTSMLNEIGRTFVNTAQQFYQRYVDPMLERKVRKLARSMHGIAHPNAIVPLETVEEIRTAKPVMQRYIMGHRALRTLYHDQRCDGYSDSYIDHEPGVVGKDHYDYRRVMNGAVTEFVTEDGEDSWKVTMYPDELHDGDRELDPEERIILRDIWERIDEALAAKEDPTDIFGGSL